MFQKNSNEWNKVFLLTAVIYIATNTLFLVFASSEEQPWNNLEENIEHNHEEDKTLVDKSRNLMNPVEYIEHNQDENWTGTEFVLLLSTVLGQLFGETV